MDKAAVLASINKAFGHLARPKVMLRNPVHCDECIDHEQVMQSVTLETISLNEIGNPGWDPVCYISDETFCYFMPAFVRLVLEDDYLFQFFFHLGHTDRIDAFDAAQRDAVTQLMNNIDANMQDAMQHPGVANILKVDFDMVIDKLTHSPR